MLAAPVGWTSRSYSFSRGKILFPQYQLWSHFCSINKPGTVCGVENICAQVSSVLTAGLASLHVFFVFVTV